MMPMFEEGMKKASSAKQAQASRGLDAKAKQRKAIIARKKKNAEKDAVFKVISSANFKSIPESPGTDRHYIDAMHIMRKLGSHIYCYTSCAEGLTKYNIAP